MEKFCLYFFYYYILLIVIKEGLFKTRAILYTKWILNSNITMPMRDNLTNLGFNLVLTK